MENIKLLKIDSLLDFLSLNLNIKFKKARFKIYLIEGNMLISKESLD